MFYDAESVRLEIEAEREASLSHSIDLARKLIPDFENQPTDFKERLLETQLGAIWMRKQLTDLGVSAAEITTAQIILGDMSGREWKRKTDSVDVIQILDVWEIVALILNSFCEKNSAANN